MITLQDKYVQKWVTKEQLVRIQELGESARRQLIDKNLQPEGKGWVSWPSDNHDTLLQKIDDIATRFRSISDVTVVIGIGGSYLGAKAALSMVSSAFVDSKDALRVVFAGNQLSEVYMGQLLTMLDAHEVTLVVISKSGGTLEPSAAFHTLRVYLEKRYGENSTERICAITDAEKGILRTFALDHKYAILPIPNDIGGRYSVLTSVGLLPMAIAGVDVRRVLAGASEARGQCTSANFDKNVAYRYAAIRHLLYLKGFTIEALVTYEPAAGNFAGWWQQLFGESQGKDGMGMFPTMLQYTTDLHSMGQYVQDARRLLIETVLDVGFTDARETVAVPDALDTSSQYMQGKSFEELKNTAVVSVMHAHEAAGVPNIHLQATGEAETLFGELVYFFETACAFGSYLLGVNGFNQPGVEAYKNEMRDRLK